MSSGSSQRRSALPLYEYPRLGCGLGASDLRIGELRSSVSASAGAGPRATGHLAFHFDRVWSGNWIWLNMRPFAAVRPSPR